MHLLRELEQTEQYKKPGEHWPAFAKKLRRLLGDAIRLWRKKGELSEETYASRRTRLAKRLQELIDGQWEDSHAKRLIKRLRRHQNDLFTFLDQDIKGKRVGNAESAKEDEKWPENAELIANYL